MTYTPAAGFEGTDTFSYSISDGFGGSDTATVVVTVGSISPANRPPVAGNDSAETPAGTPVSIPVLANDSDDGVVAYVEITLEKQTDDHMRRFEAAVRNHPEIRDCYLMAGEADYIVRAVAPDIAAYEVIHKDVLSRLPGVSRIHSSLAIRNVLAARG